MKGLGISGGACSGQEDSAVARLMSCVNRLCSSRLRSSKYKIGNSKL